MAQLGNKRFVMFFCNNVFYVNVYPSIFTKNCICDILWIVYL